MSITTLADTLEAAIRDGGELMKWAEQNTIALEDDRIEAAVLRALGGPVPDEYAVGVPLLRFPSTDVPDVPLLDAIINDKRHNCASCDRCGRRAVRTSRLLIPSGASVVAVHCCPHCRGVLQDVFDCGLVWG